MAAAVPIEVRSSRRRRTPRFLVRNARWVAEARDTPPLWTQWAPQSEEEPRRAPRDEPASAREEEWSSAYSAM
jgi:hypothetical protein